MRTRSRGIDIASIPAISNCSNPCAHGNIGEVVFNPRSPFLLTIRQLGFIHWTPNRNVRGTASSSHTAQCPRVP